MICKVTLTANAGIILALDGTILLVDALHDKKAMEFSSLDPIQAETLFSYLDMCIPDAVLVTHNHADHYSKELVHRACQRYSCPLVAPWTDGKREYSVNGVRITAAVLPHRKAPAEDYGSSFGFIIEKSGKTVLIAGDAEPLSQEMSALCASLAPDLAVLPFMWVTLRRHREALEVLSPKHMALNHLPFEKDDAFGYNDAAGTQVSALYPGCVILNSFLQSAQFEL